MQTDTDLKELWPNLPKSVKSLTVMRNVERIALTTENDHLEELDLTLQPRMLVDLAKPKWSALKKLHLRTFAAGMSYPFVDILRSAPKLEHLAVTDWRERSEIARDANNQVYLDQSIITSDELGVSAAMAAAGRGLARLDLEMGLTESAIRSLLNSELSSIGQLNIAQHAGIDAKLRAEAERACRNLNWVDPPEERDLADLSDLV